MTDNEPTVRYFVNPADPIAVYSTRHDAIAEMYAQVPGLESVHVLTESELAAHTTAARADERERIAAAIEAAGRNEVRWLSDHAQNQSDRYRLVGNEDAWKAAILIARTPDPNGDNT